MIRNREAQAQYISYDKMSYDRNFNNDQTGNGVYHPMDIDGILQFNSKTHKMKEEYNQAVLFYEFKRDKATMPVGQRICYEALADAITGSGGFSLVAVVAHNVEDPKEDVDGSNCTVKQFYYDGVWYTPKREMTAVEFTDYFMIASGLKQTDKGEM